MASTALDGKSYVGNSHVQIDEEDGASVKPKRASLFHKAAMKLMPRRLLLLAVTLTGILAVQAERMQMSIAQKDQSQIEFEFSGIRGRNHSLFVAYGTSDGRGNKRAWTNFEKIAEIGIQQSTFRYYIPNSLKAPGVSFRFFLLQEEDLPYENELEYIQSAGGANGACIHDIGVKPSATTVAQSDLMYDVNNGQYAWAFGSNNRGVANNGSLFAVGVSTEGAWFIKRLSGQIGNKTFPVGTWQQVEYSMAGGLWSNGVRIYANAETDAANYIPPNVNMSVFCCWRLEGGTYSRWDNVFPGKMGWLGVFDDGKLVRNLYPVRSLTNVAGLYDTVTGAFYPSSVAAAFEGCESTTRLGLVKAFTITLDTMGHKAAEVQLVATPVDEDRVMVEIRGPRVTSIPLYVAYGTTDGGADKWAWTNFSKVTNIAPEQVSYTYVLPNELKGQGVKCRFFLHRDTGLAYADEIAYVQSTGGTDGAYIHDIGVNPSAATVVQCELMYDVNNGQYAWAFGSNNRGVANNGSLFAVGASDGGEWFIKRLSGQIRNKTFPVGSWQQIEYSMAGGLWSNGAQIYANTASDATNYTRPGVNMAVFCCWRLENGAYLMWDNVFPGKMKSFRVKEGNWTLADLHPVQDANGVAGLYDAVVDRFYPSDSQTAFTAGTVLGTDRKGIVLAQSDTIDLASPVIAVWTGAVSDDLTDPANWECRSVLNTVIEGVLPQSETVIVMKNGHVFNVPTTMPTCKNVLLEGRIGLTSDMVWTGLDLLRTTAIDGCVIDLKGHSLTVAPSVDLDQNLTVTDSVGGGELHVVVPAGETVGNSGWALTGQLKLIKEGDGVFAAKRKDQGYSGGTEILAGKLMTAEGNGEDRTYSALYHLVGAEGSDIWVGPGATFDIAANYDYYLHHIILAGGTLKSGSASDTPIPQTEPDYGGLGWISLTTNSTFVLRSDTVFSGKDDVPIDLGGYTLSVDAHYNGKTMYWQKDIANGTVNLVGIPTAAVEFRVMSRTVEARTVDFIDGVGFNMQTNMNVRGYNPVFERDNTLCTGTAALNVYGTFRPDSDYFYGCTLQDGATLDLSAKVNAWSTTSAATTGLTTVTFADNATIYIDLGNRHLSQNEQIVAWNEESKPTNLSTLKFKPAQGKKYNIIKTENGILVFSGMCVFVR